ncbi:MAG TPA: glycosyltransferase family 87 protein [Nocardioides sp.]|uniref:glycosyltransferase family 87 protein n=1 Tax=Nocardioides sp. TaxID=35761 RepID=UPI002E36A035|nr:glycosyltransferase family 87 protein [Nocardioides sp.]HEX5087603.1 glycosyltransferase family 87 protein [Nocardioides sp.]
MTEAASSPARARVSAAAWLGLFAVLVLLLLGFGLPHWMDWWVAPRAPRNSSPHEAPPLHGLWRPNLFGPGTVPSIALALLGWRYAAGLAERLPWRHLLSASYATSLAWLLSLALVDGTTGISRVLGNPTEYLRSARAVGSVHHLIETYADRIPYGAPDSWPTSPAGHPPGMLLFFVVLDRLGLGGDLAAGLVVTCVGATTAVAVLVTLRALDAEDWARRAAPFVVLTPAAVFMAVSADAVIGAVVAWGLACLAVAAHRSLWWSVPAGLLLGYAVLMSYGMPLTGLVALGVLVAARSWRPLPVAAGSALAVVLAFAVSGFAWWEAYPVLRERYWDGIAQDRPQSYWWWGDLAAFSLAAGPLVLPGLLAGCATAASAASRTSARVVLLLSGTTALAVALADASGMSKAEVERIWLPFVPWLTLSVVLLPPGWRRWGLGLQLLTALVVQHAFYTSW